MSNIINDCQFFRNPVNPRSAYSSCTHHDYRINAYDISPIFLRKGRLSRPRWPFAASTQSFYHRSRSSPFNLILFVPFRLPKSLFSRQLVPHDQYTAGVQQTFPPSSEKFEFGDTLYLLLL